MSVPLPSPSSLSPAKPILRSRPQPITPYSPQQHSPSSPRRSVGFSPANEDNWRDRNGGLGHRSVGRSGPERTVGGFEKREVRSGSGSGSTLSAGLGMGSAKDKMKEREDGEAKTAALSRVPCRFFKAGACTAGSSCPFSHEEGGKREVCQWFLKGNCKFGHRCALAHVRPGEPMSMDRKNKKDHQRESRERGDARPRYDGGVDEHIATPVAIRSALSSSIHSPPPNRLSSSPMREPYGPPSGGLAGSPSPGFGHPRSPGLFASSPSRPSPLSGGRPSVPGPLTLKSAQSPLRPPPTTAFSSSFSHVVPAVDRSGPPLSASFADNTLRKSIWARSETPDEPLSPARRPAQPRRPRTAIDVFHDDDSYDHGEDLLPSSLSDLLTPTERTRRKSRRDSGDSVSPSRGGALLNAPFSGERLAQSAGATMGPPGFLQGLWSAEGVDARKSENNEEDFAFGPTTAQPQTRHSLLTEQRSPVSSKRPSREPLVAVEGPFLIRQPSDPHSPSARALQEHAPGQSLPGGLANALSRLHLHGPRPPSGLAHATQGGEEVLSGAETPPMGSGPSTGRTEEHEEEALFAMDG